jgi:hypothetical protein
LRLDDIVRVEEPDDTGETLVIHFFDLRPYDPSKGRKPLKDLKHLKRADFTRVVPIHPLLTDLGLLERVAHLRALGETRLFPGWEPHKSGSDEIRWGKAVSKAFGYARKRPDINLARANITLYSTRQLTADWLDSKRTPQRVRNRILGHTNDDNAADNYGNKGMMPREQASCVTDLETPIIARMREILMQAKDRGDRGELKRISTEALLRSSRKRT